MRRETATSRFRSMPVLTPIACRQWIRSSVHTLPEAPGANGQPPSPPMEASKWVTSCSMAARMLGMAIARVSWVWSVHSTPGKRGTSRSSTRATWAGLAMPVVSARPMPRAPMSTRRATTDSRCATGTSPSKGQPNEQEMPETTGTAARRATSATAASLASDSAMVMFTLARLWLSLADTTVWISSTRASTARTAPLSLGTSAE